MKRLRLDQMLKISCIVFFVCLGVLVSQALYILCVYLSSLLHTLFPHYLLLFDLNVIFSPKPLRCATHFCLSLSSVLHIVPHICF